MNISISKAAELMGVAPQHLRIMIQNGKFDFASADKLRVGNKRYSYYINAYGLATFLGKSLEEVMQ